MKVLTFDTETRVARVQLSRRNLLALLAKLDYNEELTPGSALRPSECTIASPDGGPGDVIVQAVEDAEHYGERRPGVMLDNASGRLY